MKLRTTVAVCIALFAPICLAESSVILKQAASPLVISNYTAKYQVGYRTSDSIVHEVTVKNNSGKTVEAYQIGLAAFDAFNGFMDKFNGWSIETIAVDTEKNGSWEQKPYAAFAFQKFGTGVAYVNAVRFSDGTIWRADIGAVLTELQKFEKDLKREDLKDKRN